MANLKELTEYKAKLMEMFCTSPALADLVCVSGENLIGKDLMFNRMYPYAYVPPVQESGYGYVCFKIDVPSVKKNVIKEVQITVYVMCHQNIMRLPNGKGLRPDCMAAEVDKLLNGNYDIGLGGVELLSSHEFVPITGYHGRIQKYYVEDINRLLCEV